MGRGLQCSRRHLPTRERGRYGVGFWLIEDGWWRCSAKGSGYLFSPVHERFD
jgi:hypothetical protein